MPTNYRRYQAKIIETTQASIRRNICESEEVVRTEDPFWALINTLGLGNMIDITFCKDLKTICNIHTL